MCADKFQEFAGRFKNGGGAGGGAPKGLGLGLKLVAAGVAGAYGVQQAMYTGTETSLARLIYHPSIPLFHSCILCVLFCSS